MYISLKAYLKSAKYIGKCIRGFSLHVTDAYTRFRYHLSKAICKLQEIK